MYFENNMTNFVLFSLIMQLKTQPASVRENDKHWHIYKKDVYHRLPSTKLFLQTVTHHFYRLWNTSSASYIAPHNFHRKWHKTTNKECVNVCMCPCSWVSLFYSFDESEKKVCANIQYWKLWNDKPSIYVVMLSCNCQLTFVFTIVQQLHKIKINCNWSLLLLLNTKYSIIAISFYCK